MLASGRDGSRVYTKSVFFFCVSVQLVFYWYNFGASYHMLAKMTLQLYSLSTCIL